MHPKLNLVQISIKRKNYIGLFKCRLYFGNLTPVIHLNTIAPILHTYSSQYTKEVRHSKSEILTS